MTTTIENEWITLSEKRNEVTIQRKFAGLKTEIKLDNTVSFCTVEYWERELYPNDNVIKCEIKTYRLEDLAIQDVGETHYMDALAVLSGFVQSLGKPYIIDPCRDTLINTVILPLDSENEYPLRRDTRPLIAK